MNCKKICEPKKSFLSLLFLLTVTDQNFSESAAIAVFLDAGLPFFYTEKYDWVNIWWNKFLQMASCITKSYTVLFHYSYSIKNMLTTDRAIFFRANFMLPFHLEHFTVLMAYFGKLTQFRMFSYFFVIVFIIGLVC